MHHVILWPFKKINDWLRGYYQNKQLKEQTAIQQKLLLLDTIPDIIVRPELIRSPSPPRRTDIPIVDVTVGNYGGKTYLIEGHFWISLSDEPAYKQEKYLVDVEMPKGKEENFFFYIKFMLFPKIISGQSVLKFLYELRFKDVNGQPQEKKRSHTYNTQKNAFVADPDEQAATQS